VTQFTFPGPGRLLYFALSQFGDREDITMDREDENQPLSASNVSLKLAMIQKRVSELAAQDASAGLSLEDSKEPQDNTNPYDFG